MIRITAGFVVDLTIMVALNESENSDVRFEGLVARALAVSDTNIRQ
jgi:hypothetical protein